MNKYEGKLTKPYDTAIFAYTVLKRLGCGKIDTFEQRLKSQKVQYFAQLFGVSPPYQFNLYVRGPYSPALAHDLFKINSSSIVKEVKIDKFTPEELEKRFTELKSFIVSQKTVKQLEITATLHWLFRMVQLPEIEAKKKTIELKGASSDEIEKAFKSIKELR